MERHPLEPFLPENARILMLGSFPPPIKRWSIPFFYPNMQNDMWRIYGLIFFNDKDHFVEVKEKRFNQPLLEAFLREKGNSTLPRYCHYRTEGYRHLTHSLSCARTEGRRMCEF